MPSLKLTVHVNDRDTQKAFDQLAALGEDMTPVFEDIGEQLKISVEDRFRDEKDPDGNKWQANVPSVAARKKHPKILTETGSLRGSINYDPSPTQVAIGSNLEYAAIHQLGGEAGPKARRVTIPARPFLGLSSADRVEITGIIQDHVAQALKP